MDKLSKSQMKRINVQKGRPMDEGVYQDNVERLVEEIKQWNAGLWPNFKDEQFKKIIEIIRIQKGIIKNNIPYPGAQTRKELDEVDRIAGEVMNG